jgi:hypothetical protein
MAAKKKNTAKKPKQEVKAPVDVEVDQPKKPELPEIQVFKMIRNNDESQISGTGVVLQGVLWPDGHVTLQWCVEDKPPSETRYNSWKDFKLLHIDMHATNDTEIVWYDIRKRPKKEE